MSNNVSNVSNFYKLLEKSLENINKVTNKNNDVSYERNIYITHLISVAMRNKDRKKGIQGLESILEIYKDKLQYKTILFIKYNIGSFYFKLCNIEKCRDYYEELYPEYSKFYSKEDGTALLIEECLITCYFLLKDYKLTLYHSYDFIPRYKIFIKDDKEYIMNIFNIEINIVDCYIKLNDIDKALQKIKEIKNIIYKYKIKESKEHNKDVKYRELLMVIIEKIKCINKIKNNF